MDAEHLLVQSKMSGGVKTSKLLTSFTGPITFENGVFTFNNLKVTKDKTDGQVMAEIETLTIRNVVDYSA